MAVVVRLARFGRKNFPCFRVVVADQRFKKEGRHIETVGSVDRTVNPAKVQLNAERINFWCGQGAKLTPIVGKLMRDAAK